MSSFFIHSNNISYTFYVRLNTSCNAVKTTPHLFENLPQIVYNAVMNQDRVKEILLETADTELEFSVVFTGKSSKKVNGLYKPDTHEIILHNKNFANDNELIYSSQAV